jgi:signal peptidase I
MESTEAPWWRVVLVGRNPRRTFVRIVVLVAVVFLGRRYVLLPVRVAGISMMPTHRDGQIKLINRLAYKLGKPQRGDIVAIRFAGEHLMLMKRVIGLPGETVAFQGGVLMINGKPWQEAYVKLSCDWEIAPVMVGPGEYYVAGDNRSMPPRDHTKGKAPLHRIVGRTFL